MTTTAAFGSKFTVTRISALIAAPFVAVGQFLVLLAEASPRMRALEKLNRVSDADLAARGLTRDGEVRRILGVNASI